MILPLKFDWFYSHVRTQFSDDEFTYHLIYSLANRRIHLELDESETVLLSSCSKLANIL
jgi:hypothetical protein